MTLKQLQAFYWASVLGSFGLAAEKLHTTQSSLSKRIAELEADLGERLFDRSGLRARSTEAGERLFERAARMLELEEDIRASLLAPGGLRGTCRFGIGEFVAHTWLPAFVARIREAHPDVVLEPHVSLAKPLMASVARGDLDFAVVPAPSSNASLRAEPLREVEMVWTGAPSLVGSRVALSRQMFEANPVITLDAGSGVTMAFEAWATANSLKFQRMISTNSMSTVAALTVSGIGLSLLARGFVESMIELNQLVELKCEADISDPPPLAYFLLSRVDDERALLRALRPVVFEEANFALRSVLLPHAKCRSPG